MQAEPCAAAAAAEPGRDKAGATAEQSCAKCGVSLESASLLLACEHHLCLLCAALALQHKGGHRPCVQCHICDAVTDVGPSAAQYLEGLRPESTRTTASGRGGLSSEKTTSPYFASTPGQQHVESRQAQAQADCPPSVSSHGSLPRPLPLPVPVKAGSAEAKPASILSMPSALAPAGGGMLRSSLLWQPVAASAAGAAPREGTVVQQPAAALPDTVVAESHRGLSTSPAAASTAPAPTLGTRCGQCDDRAAEVYCVQCDEVFCRPCAQATHRRGRMAEHQLQPLDHAGPLSHLVDAAIDSQGSSSRWAEPAPLARRFLRCRIHPEEPLQYFCLQCQTECICAECVIHGEHRGHEVLNVREAVKRLPEKVGELANTTRLRAEEIAGHAQRAQEGRRELAAAAERGRAEVRGALKTLGASLRQDEKVLLGEVERCVADVAEVLRVDSEAALVQALEELQKHQEAGDAARALAWYSKLKQLVDSPERQRLDADRVASQLRGQLQRGFESRLAGLAGLSSSVLELQVLPVLQA